MNAKSLSILLLQMLLYQSAWAQEGTTNQWGSVACGVAQLSAAVMRLPAATATNQPIMLSIQTRNVGTNAFTITHVSSYHDFSYVLVAPSGRELRSKLPPKGDVEFIKRDTKLLSPQESDTSQLDLRGIYNITELGTYTLVVRRKVIVHVDSKTNQFCEVTSNELKLDLK